MKAWIVVIAALVVACKDKSSTGSATGSAAGSAAGTTAGSALRAATGSATGGATGSAASAEDTDGEPDGIATDDQVVASVCARAEACKCPVPDCPKFFNDLAMSRDIYECLAKQECDVLCAPKAGAPGTPLYENCIEGNMPAPAADPAKQPCASTASCPARHECCGGYCYEMGTSLWITVCQMPTGKF